MTVLNERYRGVCGLTPQEQLRCFGPYVRVAIEKLTPGAAPEKGQALIDTGAKYTVIDMSVVNKLGLKPIQTNQINAIGQSNVPVRIYQARVRITKMNKNFDLSYIIGENLSAQKIIALIGRDILENCILVYNGPDGSFSLSI